MSTTIDNTSLGATYNNPHILWHSVLSPSEIIPQNYVGTTSAQNLWSNTLSDYYESDDISGALEVSLDFNLVNTSDSDINYIALAGHNIYDLGGEVRVRSSDDGGSTWTDVIPRTPVDGRGPIALLFDESDHALFRISVYITPNATVNLKISHLRAGLKTVLNAAVLIGTTPTELDRRVTKQGVTSTTGHYLGSFVTSVVYRYDIQQRYVTKTQLYEDVDPFLAHCDQVPTGIESHNGPDATFFYLRRLVSDRNAIAYCNPPKNISRPIYSTASLLYDWGITGESASFDVIDHGF